MILRILQCIGHVLLIGTFQIRDLRHNNIVQFIGATVEPNVSNIVTEYCSKGSLEVLFTLCFSTYRYMLARVES